MGGVKLPQALAELGLIDEYEFVVHPRVAGHGPTLFAGLSKRVDLKLVSRLESARGRWRCGTSRDGSRRTTRSGPAGEHADDGRSARAVELGMAVALTVAMPFGAGVASSRIAVGQIFGRGDGLLCTLGIRVPAESTF